MLEGVPQRWQDWIVASLPPSMLKEQPVSSRKQHSRASFRTRTPSPPFLTCHACLFLAACRGLWQQPAKYRGWRFQCFSSLKMFLLAIAPGSKIYTLACLHVFLGTCAKQVLLVSQRPKNSPNWWDIGVAKRCCWFLLRKLRNTTFGICCAFPNLHYLPG